MWPTRPAFRIAGLFLAALTVSQLAQADPGLDPRALREQWIQARARAHPRPLQSQTLNTSLSTSSVSSCAQWSELSPDQTPFVRDDQSMVYDAVRDRLLIFGGTTADGGSYYFSNEVWAVSLTGAPALTQLTPSGTPPDPRSNASLIYDSVRDRLVMFGGIGQFGAFADTWELTLSGTPTWNELSPAGTIPPTLAYHTAIYDVTRDRMVVFGGYDYGGGGEQNQVHLLTFTGTPTWSSMAPSGTAPAPRNVHSAVYDGPRDRMVVFGGISNALGELNDTWALSLAGSGAWSQVSPNGGPPAVRFGHTAIVDAPRNRMLVFGGYVNDEPYAYADVWSLSFTNPIKWTQLSPTGPTPALAPYFYFASVYDPVRQRMISAFADEFWTLGNLSGTPAWSMLTPAGQVPRRRWGAMAIYDAPRSRMVLFGGFLRLENAEANDLWAYSPAGGTWSRIIPSNPGPPVRASGTAIYDPAGDRMIVFGGSNDIGMLNDTWQLSLAGTPTWTHLTPSGTSPVARSGHTAILDQPRNRMVVHGGADASSNLLSDVWALSLSGGTSWSALNPTGGPAQAVEFHTSVFDAPRNRMLTYGWNDNSVGVLNLVGTPSWSVLSAGGTPPPVSSGGHVAVYDAPRDRMLISMVNGSYVHELSLAGSPTWSLLGVNDEATPISRWSATSVFDSGAGRWLIFGGDSYNDLQALSFPTMYPLNVQASPVAGGSVNESPANTCFASGTMVTLTAVPAANYLFTGWSGDASGTTNPITVTMNAAKNITANFDDYTLNVFISPVAGGTVTKNPNLAHYPPNSDVTLTANPALGYGFVNWSGDASGSTNPITVTMTSTKNITANFAGYPVNVATSPSGAGTVTKNPNQATYAPGTQVTLTASSSYPFVGWSGDASGNTNPLTITVDGPKNITATFLAYTVTTIVSPAGAGSVSKTPSASFYNPGTKVALGAAPVLGYQFSSWSGDLTGSNNPDTVLVNGNKTVTANFVLTPAVCGGWSIVPTASQPQGRDGAAAIWDPVRHRMVISGGTLGYFVATSDLWSLALGGAPAWNLLLDQSGNLADRVGIYDPVRDRMLVFGGHSPDFSDGNGGQPNMDTWAVSLSGTPTWTQLVTAHTPPARRDPSVIYDPLRDRLLLFGGGIQNGQTTYQRLNDVWQLNLAGTPDWTQITPAGTPPPIRMKAGAIYDPVRDRMVIMAGDGTTPTGAWALSLSGPPTWADLNPWGAPHVTKDFRPIYDAARDRAVIVWGDGTGVITTLDFKGNPNQPLWAKVYPLQSGGALGVRGRPAVVYDSDDDLILVFGGSTAPYTYTTSSLRLDLSGGYFVDGGGTNGGVSTDKWCYSSGETANLMGGPNQGYQFSQWFGDASGTANPTSITVNANNVVRAEFVANVTGAEEALPLAFGLEVRPNPAVGAAAIHYALPRAAEVKLRVFDVAGREVARLVDGSQPAGTHVATWNGAKASLRAGIYLVRFETPAGAWTNRLVLLR